MQVEAVVEVLVVIVILLFRELAEQVVVEQVLALL
jgi:hypothetical protein